MKTGSLFSGYGGIEMGLGEVFDIDVRWHVEFDEAASAVLSRRWPAIPNYGDITAVDWSAVEPVDVLCGGFPCQDISNAGKRKGIQGERSGLWKSYARAIRELRPQLVVVENVAALNRRGLDVVLGDLAALGFDAEWTVVRASEAGAPHRRERLFIVAISHASSELLHGSGPQGYGWFEHSDGSGAFTDAESVGRDERRPESTRQLGRPGAASGGIQAGNSGRRGGLDGHSDEARPAEVLRELRDVWGPYAPAISRWEILLGRPAPAPTVTGARGGQVLSARLVEWLMGLPAGHVTDVPGLSRNNQLKILGNGVVPQQAALAVRHLLHQFRAEVAA